MVLSAEQAANRLGYLMSSVGYSIYEPWKNLVYHNEFCYLEEYNGFLTVC